MTFPEGTFHDLVKDNTGVFPFITKRSDYMGYAGRNSEHKAYGGLRTVLTFIAWPIAAVILVMLFVVVGRRKKRIAGRDISQITLEESAVCYQAHEGIRAWMTPFHLSVYGIFICIMFGLGWLDPGARILGYCWFGALFGLILIIFFLTSGIKTIVGKPVNSGRTVRISEKASEDGIFTPLRMGEAGESGASGETGESGTSGKAGETRASGASEKRGEAGETKASGASEKRGEAGAPGALERPADFLSELTLEEAWILFMMLGEKKVTLMSIVGAYFAKWSAANLIDGWDSAFGYADRYSFNPGQANSVPMTDPEREMYNFLRGAGESRSSGNSVSAGDIERYCRKKYKQYIRWVDTTRREAYASLKAKGLVDGLYYEDSWWFVTYEPVFTLKGKEIAGKIRGFIKVCSDAEELSQLLSEYDGQ